MLIAAKTENNKHFPRIRAVANRTLHHSRNSSLASGLCLCGLAMILSATISITSLAAQTPQMQNPVETSNTKQSTNDSGSCQTAQCQKASSSEWKINADCHCDSRKCGDACRGNNGRDCDEFGRSCSEVPILCDIPCVDRMFTSTKSRKSQEPTTSERARNFLHRLENSNVDEDLIAELLAAEFQKIEDRANQRAAKTISELKVAHAGQLAAMQQTVFQMKQDALTRQFSQQLKPLALQQNRMQQMMIELEARLLELQQNFHQLSAQKSQTPRGALSTSYPALTEPTDHDENGTCDKCRQRIVEFGVPIPGQSKAFSNKGSACGCTISR